MARRKSGRSSTMLEDVLRMAFGEALQTSLAELRSRSVRSPYRLARSALAERLAETALLFCGGDKRRAARMLGCSLSTLKSLS
jgi:DNA-binding protein Fis